MLKFALRRDSYGVECFFFLLITEKVVFEKVIVYTLGSSVCSDTDLVRVLK